MGALQRDGEVVRMEDHSPEPHGCCLVDRSRLKPQDTPREPEKVSVREKNLSGCFLTFSNRTVKV